MNNLKRIRKKSLIEEVFIHNETILKGLHCYLHSEEEIQTRKFRFKAFQMPMLHTNGPSSFEPELVMSNFLLSHCLQGNSVLTEGSS